MSSPKPKTPKPKVTKPKVTKPKEPRVPTPKTTKRAKSKSPKERRLTDHASNPAPPRPLAPRKRAAPAATSSDSTPECRGGSEKPRSKRVVRKPATVAVRCCCVVCVRCPAACCAAATRLKLNQNPSVAAPVRRPAAAPRVLSDPVRTASIVDADGAAPSAMGELGHTGGADRRPDPFRVPVVPKTAVIRPVPRIGAARAPHHSMSSRISLPVGISAAPPKVLRPVPANGVTSTLREKTYFVGNAAYMSAVRTAKSVLPPAVPEAMMHSPLHPRIVVLVGKLGLLQTAVATGVNRTSEIVFNFPSYCYLPEENWLLVRFCLNPSKTYPADQRPHNLCLSINDKNILKPACVDYRSSLKYHHAYTPVEVNLNDVKVGMNTLVVEWTVTDGKGPAEDFFLFLEVARKKTLEVICVDLSSSKIQIPDSIAKLYQNLARCDDEICGNSRSLSLICGLSQKRLQIPARGKICQHLECFDLASFLQMNQALNGKWNCPVCSGPASFSELVVDEFVVDLLNQFPTSKLVDVIAENSSIRVREQKKAESKVAKLIEVMHLDESVIIL